MDGQNDEQKRNGSLRGMRLLRLSLRCIYRERDTLSQYIERERERERETVQRRTIHHAAQGTRENGCMNACMPAYYEYWFNSLRT